MKNVFFIFILSFLLVSCNHLSNNEDRPLIEVVDNSPELDQNYYLKANGIPVTGLALKVFAEKMGLQKIENLYQDQIAKFEQKPSKEEREFIRRNVFVNEVSQLILTEFLDFENEADKDKLITYSLSFIKTGPIHQELGIKTFEYLKKVNALSKQSQQEVAFLLNYLSEQHIISLEDEIVTLSKAIHDGQDEGLNVALTELKKKAESDLAKAKILQITFEKEEQRPINLNDKHYLTSKFLESDLQKVGINLDRGLK